MGGVDDVRWGRSRGLNFYPNVSPDGKTLLYSYDAKDRFNTFRVDLAIWAMPPVAYPPASDTVRWSAQG